MCRVVCSSRHGRGERSVTYHARFAQNGLWDYAPFMDSGGGGAGLSGMIVVIVIVVTLVVDANATGCEQTHGGGHAEKEQGFKWLHKVTGFRCISANRYR